MSERSCRKSCKPAWFRPETLGASTLITTPRYALSAFVLPPGVKQWMETQSLSHALLLQGPPGTGKTEMAVSALSQLCPGGVHFVSKQDQMKKIEVRPGQGILLDEACFRESTVDDAKAWVDVAFAQDVRGRCSDGHIPPLTRRVFTTNHDLAQFWPVEYFTPNQKGAIDRRRWSVRRRCSSPRTGWPMQNETLQTAIQRRPTA